MAGGFREPKRGRRALFGSDADAYESGRPGYPTRIFDLLRERCDLEPGCRVVEIGAGTGQATGMLLDAGAHVVAVELSANLARRLAARHGSPALEVRIGAFEDQDFTAGSVDLIASATAFHWVPTGPGLERCANALAEGGWLALWWNVFGDPERPDPFRDALEAVLRKIEPSLLDFPGAGNPEAGAPPYALDATARTEEIAATGRFGPVHHEAVRWTGDHRPDELRALFATFSPWLVLPADRRQRALDAVEQIAVDEFDGAVERPYVTSIYLSQRT